MIKTFHFYIVFVHIGMCTGKERKRKVNLTGSSIDLNGTYLVYFPLIWCVFGKRWCEILTTVKARPSLTLPERMSLRFSSFSIK